MAKLLTILQLYQNNSVVHPQSNSGTSKFASNTLLHVLADAASTVKSPADGSTYTILHLELFHYCESCGGVEKVLEDQEPNADRFMSCRTLLYYTGSSQLGRGMESKSIV